MIFIKKSRRSQKTHVKGFALIIALALMSFIIILLLSLSTLLNVELKVATNRASIDHARTNAMLGAQIALAQLQIYAGPDQRVSAPATVAYPDKGELGTSEEGEFWDIFRSHATGLPLYSGANAPTGWRTFLEEDFNFTNDPLVAPSAGREAWNLELANWWSGKNPRWTGVWESESRMDNGDFERQQTPRWLVSGNESQSLDEQVTPDADLTGDKIPHVSLVGYGSSAPLNADDNPNPDDKTTTNDGLDGGVIAPLVYLSNAKGQTSGAYAYWVGGENIKANYALVDPYYDVENRNSIEYRNRLQVPQRVGWQKTVGFDEIFESYSDSEQKEMINGDAFQRIATSNQIALIDLDNGERLSNAVRQNFHNVTGYSQGIFTDTARGGLKKDLSVYLQTGNGLSDSDPIPNPGGNDPFDYRNDPRMGANNNGFPKTSTNIPTWGEIRDWYDNVASAGSGGMVDVGGAYFPVITQMRIYVGFTHEAGMLRFHVAPQIALWNPYDAGLREANYELRLKIHPEITQLRIADKTDLAINPEHEQVRKYENGDRYFFPTLSAGGILTAGEITANFVTINDDDPNAGHVFGEPDDPGHVAEKNFPAYDIEILPENSELIIRFRASFEPGESLMFTPATDHQLGHDASPLGGERLIVELENDFSPDDPASGYIEIANIQSSITATDEDGNLADFIFNLSGTDTGIWSEDATLGGGKNIEMYIDGELYQHPMVFGDLDGEIRNQMNAIRRPYLKVDQPQIWRRLYSSSNTPIGIGSLDPTSYTNRFGSDPKAPEVFLFQVGETYLDPFYINVAGYIATSRAADTSFRPFANYNILAKQFESFHPYVDYRRGKGFWDNPDGWARFSALRSSPGSIESQNKVNDFWGQKSALDDISKNPDGTWKHYEPGHFPTKDNNYGTVEGGMPWNAQDGAIRSEIIDGKARSFSLVQLTKGPDDVSQSEGPASPPYIEALSQIAIRPVRRVNSNVVSLGQLQHVNVSPFMWQPAYPIGNSEASPYVDRDTIAGLTARPVFKLYDIINEDGDVIKNKQWLMNGYPNDNENMFVDMSYLLNDALWDRYFLSTISQSGDIPLSNDEPLPNSRIRFYSNKDLAESDVRGFNKSAAHVYNEGAFNVNSTSVEAWKALLFAFRDLKLPNQDDSTLNPDETVPVVRSMAPLKGPVHFAFEKPDSVDSGTYYDSFGAVGNSVYSDYSKILGGYRYMTDDMVEVLAQRIVDEVRMRGPFYSMADFVNRRLVGPDGSRDPNSDWTYARTGLGGGSAPNNAMSHSYDALVGLQGLNGALQRAINVSGINGGVNYPKDNGIDISDPKHVIDHVYYPRSHSDSGPDWSRSNEYRFGIYPSLPYYLDMENKAGAPVGEQGLLYSHSPGFITQADLLTMLGPVLTARDDTFIIRSYGSSVNKLTGAPEAEAWLELHVRRIPNPVFDSDGNNEPDPLEAGKVDLGRKFEIVDFRWLTKDEV